MPYYLLRLFSYNITLIQNGLIVNGQILNFIDACVASSAYYLLVLLILFTKDIEFIKIIKMFIIGSLIILAMNVIRVTTLILILINYGTNLFETVHLAYWRFVATIYIFVVWIILIKIYKIKEIPIYSDIKYLYNTTKKKKC